MRNNMNFLLLLIPLLISLGAHSYEKNTIPPSIKKDGIASLPPIIVNVLPTKKTDKELEEEAKEKAAAADLDTQLVALTGELSLFTAGLFWATFALFCTAIWQGLQLRKSVKIAQQSADVSTNSLVITQRPWLTIKEYVAIEIKNGTKVVGWTFRGVTENSGNTPAKNVYGGVAMFEVPSGAPLGRFSFNLGHAVKSILNIAPRGTSTVQGIQGKNTVTREQLDKITNGEIDVYFCASIHYSDIFPNSPPRETSICMKLFIDSIDTNGKINFGYNAHSQYNEAT